MCGELNLERKLHSVSYLYINSSIIHQLTFEVHGLIELELGDHLEGLVDLIEGEELELLDVVARLVEVVEEHLAHLVDGHRGVDRAVQAEPADHVGEAADVEVVGVREQDGVDLGERQSLDIQGGREVLRLKI